MALVLITRTDQKLNPVDDDKYATSSCYKEETSCALTRLSDRWDVQNTDGRGLLFGSPGKETGYLIPRDGLKTPSEICLSCAVRLFAT